MRRLSGMDAAFLYAETPTWQLHGGAVMILEPSTAPFMASTPSTTRRRSTNAST